MSLMTLAGCAADSGELDVDGFSSEEGEEGEEVEGQQRSSDCGQRYWSWGYCQASTNLCGVPAWGGGVSSAGRATGTQSILHCQHRRTGRWYVGSRGACLATLDRYGCPQCNGGNTCFMWGRCQDVSNCGWHG